MEESVCCRSSVSVHFSRPLISLTKIFQIVQRKPNSSYLTVNMAASMRLFSCRPYFCRFFGTQTRGGLKIKVDIYKDFVRSKPVNWLWQTLKRNGLINVKDTRSLSPHWDDSDSSSSVLQTHDHYRDTGTIQILLPVQLVLLLPANISKIESGSLVLRETGMREILPPRAVWFQWFDSTWQLMNYHN